MHACRSTLEDPTSLRKATGSATSPWHAGTGAFADLDWLEGGNNDMFKGLVYAQLIGWRLLCKTHLSDAESTALCARIETNAKHLADDVNVDRGLNQVPAYWLASIVTGDASYEVKASAYWTAGKIEQKNDPVRYDDGIADWSGINLTFTGDLILALLAEEKNLGGDAVSTMRDAIDQSHAVLARQRLLVWHLLHATHGTGAKASPFIDDMRWRLREIPWPKRAFGEIDHTLEDGFCLSPYPNVPWKNDWTTTDRTNTLNQFPVFELPVDVNYFKQPPAYRGPADYETPGVDYLHAYWLARRYALIAAGD